MKIFDISAPLSDILPVWKGDPSVQIDRKVINESNDIIINSSRIAMGVHCGTHIDAPRHFIPDGNTIDKMALDILIGTALVCEITDPEKIDCPEIKEHDLTGVQRILFKTKNSGNWPKEKKFNEKFIYLAPDGASYLVEKGIKLIGIDYLSIDKYQATNYPVHHILLSNDIVIVEGLNLHSIKPGLYELICLPLSIPGNEGSPARAVLRTME